MFKLSDIIINRRRDLLIVKIVLFNLNSESYEVVSDSFYLNYLNENIKLWKKLTVKKLYINSINTS